MPIAVMRYTRHIAMGSVRVIMPKEVARTHVVIPRELVESVDEIVGARHRSEFFVEAVAEKLCRIKLLRAAKEVAGSLKDVDIPGWETPESASAWVRKIREEADRRLEEKWNRS